MLEVRDIYKSYEGKPLLRGVSFTVDQGETVCLLGASGSGKTTLLRIIAGLEQPEAGQVLWDGQSLADVPVHRRNFGLMFQDYALFPHRGVAENVAFGLRMQGLPRARIDEQVTHALTQVNLNGFGARRVTDLSGGEQQRVALARALAPRPRLLMFDEPLGALDRALKEQVETDLRRLLRETGIPAIYVTHDQEEAFAVADRLILLHDGLVVQTGAPAQVYDRPANAWVARFLGLNNLLPGQVQSIAPLRVATELGVFQGAWVASTPPRIGQPLMLLLRPNAARAAPALAPHTAVTGQDKAFSASDADGLNHLRGVVADHVFRGDGFHVTLRCAVPQGSLDFSFRMEQPYDPGQPLTVVIQDSGVQFLPG